MFRDSRISILAAIVVSAVVVTLGVVLDHENRNFHQRELHIRTDNDVALIEARLMGQISTDLAVMRSLANAMAATPDFSPGTIREQLQRILLQNPHFRSVALAPDFVVRDVMPAGAPGEVVGEDVRVMLGRDASPALANDRLSARFAGPVAIGEDGGFAVLFPVVLRKGDTHSVWGAVRAVIDENQFYRSAGLLPSSGGDELERHTHFQHLRVALSLKAAPGMAPRVFFGDADVLRDKPVRHIFAVPGGAWELAAIPAGGWDQPPPNQNFLRSTIMLTGAIIIIPVLLSCLLMVERSRNVAMLQTREAKLLEVSQRLQLALDSSRIGIWEIDTQTREVIWDRRAAALHGQGNKDLRLSVEDWLALVHPQDRLTAETHFFTCSSGGIASRLQFRIVLADGSIRHMRSAGTHYGNSTRSSRTIGIVRDVTGDVAINDDLRAAKETSDIKNAELELALAELSSREQELEELSRRLDVALDSYRCGIWEVDLDTGNQIWDERMHRLYELPYSSGSFSTEAWLELIHPDDRAKAAVSTPHTIGVSMSEPLIVRIRLKDGSTRYIRSMGKSHRTRDGRGRVIGIAFDFTADALMTEALKAAKMESDLKNAELQFAKSCIEHNALHDPLTKLGNRRKLDLELERLSEASRLEAQSISILHIDLDRFKQINDTLGHAAGDAMLKRTADVLLKATRPTDLVARIGGDEFVIVVKDNAGAKDMAKLAARIIEAMRQPLEFGGTSSRCGVSIGIAQEKGYDLDTRQMLVNADIALYRAKGTGRNRHEFFTQNLQAEIITAKQVADDILAGLEDHQFTAWYQPQFDARTMHLTGVEALVRWNHPSRGLLTPDRFLKIAEELNVVATLDRIVLETALKDKMRWTAMGIDIPKLSVNVSARRLHDQGLYETLKTLPIRPGEIAFELVESIFLDESEDVVSQNIDRIKSLGIEIEIDDFGTGHTSIVSLLKLQPHRLKIDRQLVRPMLDSPRERTLVQSIIGIAHSLGVKTVAEGVETFEHAHVLSELGCDQLQGYAFAKPLSFDALSIFARSEAWRKVS